MTDFQYLRPSNLAEAFSLMSEHERGMFVAGGTDLLLRVREGRTKPSALISLRGVRELGGIEVGEEIRIGGAVTVAEILEHEALCAAVPGLPTAASTLGSAQIRNVATVAGNLVNASPCADLAPPLLVNDARVLLRTGDATRELDLRDFFVAPGETRLGPGELVAALLLRKPPAGRRARFTKMRRVQMDISIASLAVALELEGGVARAVRVAAGSVAPKPLRLVETEKLLEGSKLDDATLEAAAMAAQAEVTPITDIRSTAEYRRHVTGVLLRRSLVELKEGGTQ